MHIIDQDLYDAASGRLVLSDLDDINDFFSQSKFSGPFTGNTGSVLVISGLDTVLYRTMKQFSMQFHTDTQEKTPQKEAEILEY